MIMIDNSKYAEIIRDHLSEINDMRIPLSIDMFLVSQNTILQHEYAIAVNDKGEDSAILCNFSSSYIHNYDYTGSVDTSFIDEYDILLLHDCNEYSVELVRAALDKWSGHTLVLVGRQWQYVIEDLPDLPGIECIWQDDLFKGFLDDLTSDRTFLHVTKGVPCEEPMTRYEDHIMSYDEVMAFTFLFSHKKELGPRNPDKNFFVVDAIYDNLGLFTLEQKASSIARYVKKKGFIPVMRLKDEYGHMTIYQDHEGDDIWAKFYNQPEGYSLSEVMESRNVYFPPGIYNARIMQTLMDRYSAGVTLTWPEGLYNKRICDHLSEKEKEFLPYPEKTLGVLARGTDYVGTHLANHAIHASKEAVGDKIDELLEEWGLEYVFIATEDESYQTYYSNRFGKRAFFTDQQRFTTEPGQMLAQMHRDSKDKADGYRLGADYILAIYLLSRCDSFLASGSCTGVGAAVKMNDGKYRHKYIFQLGKN